MSAVATVTADLDLAVRDALAGVFDPCSVACSSPLSLLDMGLIRGWRYDADARRLDITMVVTSPGCFMVENMIAGIREQLAEVEAIDAIHVTVDNDVLWTPAMMTAGGRESLDRRRAESRRRLALRPRQWQDASNR